MLLNSTYKSIPTKNNVCEYGQSISNTCVLKYDDADDNEICKQNTIHTQ